MTGEPRDSLVPTSEARSLSFPCRFIRIKVASRASKRASFKKRRGGERVMFNGPVHGVTTRELTKKTTFSTWENYGKAPHKLTPS